MKKITFILLALISGTVFAQNSANANAAVNAKIVEPITITLSSGSLDFGTFASPESDAAVVLTPAGQRTFPENSEMLIGAYLDVSVPEFTVSRDNNVTTQYSIGLAVTDQPDGVSVSDLKHSLEGSAYSAESFTVGGTLNVPAGQTAGTYEGTINVTVTYE